MEMFLARPSSVMQQDTLSAQVVRRILDMITTERLKVGDLVPSEVALSEKLQISRGIVREAYRTLASMGILTIQSGKRPRIREMDTTVLAQFFAYVAATSQVSAEQILALRRVVEIQVAVMAAENGTEDDFARIHEAGQKLHEVPISDPDWIARDYDLHIAIAGAVHNPLFYILIGALRAPLEASMRAGLAQQVINRTDSHTILDYHDRIIACICSRDAEGAGRAMQDHFDAPVAALLKG